MEGTSNKIFNSWFSFALGTARQFVEAQNNYQSYVLIEWKKTYDMPRKMKKARRKELETNWKIATYDPMGIREIMSIFN